MTEDEDDGAEFTERRKIDVQWVCFLLRLYKIDRERDIKWQNIVVKCVFPFFCVCV